MYRLLCIVDVHSIGKLNDEKPLIQLHVHHVTKVADEFFDQFSGPAIEDDDFVSSTNENVFIIHSDHVAIGMGEQDLKTVPSVPKVPSTLVTSFCLSSRHTSIGLAN